MTWAVLRNIGVFLCVAVIASAAEPQKKERPVLCGIGMSRVGSLSVDHHAHLPEFPATRELTYGDKAFFDNLYAHCQGDCTQFNFVSMWGWHPYDKYEVSRIGRATLVSMQGPHGRVFLEPLGVSAQEAADTIVQVLQQPGVTFSHVGKGVADLLAASGKGKVSEQRDLAEYVYSSKDLSELQSHKDLRHKKKQVDAFFETHKGATYVSLNDHPELLPAVKEFLDGWKSGGPENEKTKAEKAASASTLAHFKEFGMDGGALIVDGKIAGFSLGKKVNDGLFAIYVEKADPVTYPGSYAAVNQRFAERIAGQGIPYINRMDDWGVPGLRQAKKQYQPVYMVDNFKVERPE